MPTKKELLDRFNEPPSRHVDPQRCPISPETAVKAAPDFLLRCVRRRLVFLKAMAEFSGNHAFNNAVDNAFSSLKEYAASVEIDLKDPSSL